MDSEDAQQFKTHVRRYLQIVENENRLKEELNVLKQEKSQIENSVLDFMERNSYQDRDFIVGDYKLKYQRTKETGSVTKAYTYERLVQYLNQDEDKAKEALEFIYSGRNSTYKTSLKCVLQKKNSDE